jgi:DUF4097 and DUF4098 domain-containing protein YvlB
MWIKGIAGAVAALLALPVQASERCDEQADRDAEIDAAGVERVEIVALAGDLEVRGGSGGTIRAHGRACARDAEALDRVRLESERRGTTARIVVEIPRDIDEASLELRVDLPQNLPVQIVDTSGDAWISGVAALELRDSSGDADVQKVAGAVTVEDSSGDVELTDVGDVHVASDSSGDLRISRARSVRIDMDSSGEIVVRDVAGDVSIGDDSSGGIYVSDVGGAFSVENDGTGEIDYDRVTGEVRVPHAERW